MRTLIGIVLVLIGGGIVLYGLWQALTPLFGLYQGALADPMGQPDGTEESVSASMLDAVKIGAIGLPFLIIGTVLLKISFYRRLFSRLPRR